MTEPRTLRVLSLGAGIQSTTVLLMACAGELPGLEAAVFADTGWEPRAVYRHLWWLAGQAEAAGIPIFVTWSGGHIREDALDAGHRFASMPVFTLEDGKKGQARRQCTKEYKIEPIGKTIRREVLGLAPGRSPRGVIVEQWLGISKDESERMSDPRVAYMRHRYPLIDLGMTRADCVEWLGSHGFPTPPKSSCIGCPYHGDAFWRALRDDSPEEFPDACDFDDELRTTGRMQERFDGKVFIHAARIPLRSVDLRTIEQRGQGALFDGESYAGECDSGYCFV